MSGVELGLIALVGFLVSIMSAIASGGGGFVMTPLLILLGLSPAQAIATGKVGGLAVTLGSLSGMKGRVSGAHDKKKLLILLLLAFIAGLLAPKVIVTLDSGLYEKFLGVFLVLVGPLIYFKKIGHQSKKISPMQEKFGFLLVFTTLLLQGIFSTGMGIFVSLAMISGLGLDALDANINKRTTQLVLNSTILVSLFTSGLIVWSTALIVIVGNFIGSYIGGKIAVKKGNKLVSLMLAALAFISGILLLL